MIKLNLGTFKSVFVYSLKDFFEPLIKIVKGSTSSIDKKSYPEYHCVESCNNCGGTNDTKVTDSLEGYPLEYSTVCKDCGFKDHWAHGWFESSQNIKSKCNTYNFNKEN